MIPVVLLGPLSQRCEVETSRTGQAFLVSHDSDWLLGIVTLKPFLIVGRQPLYVRNKNVPGAYAICLP